MARPTIFSQHLADRILARIAEGEYLIAICRDDDMPDRATVNRWRDRDVTFCDKIARARARGVEYRVEEAGEIADDGANDYTTKKRADGSEYEALDVEHVQRSKLRIETRYREAEALAPKVYGKRQMIEHSGGIHVTKESDDELIAELLNLAATGRLKLPGGVELELGEDQAQPDEDDGLDDFSTIGLADDDDDDDCGGVA